MDVRVVGEYEDDRPSITSPTSGLEHNKNSYANIKNDKNDYGTASFLPLKSITLIL